MIGELQYDEVVIGCTLEALLYAYIYNLPVIYTEYDEPFIFDRLPAGLDFLSFMPQKNKGKTLLTNNGAEERGMKKQELFIDLEFALSMQGLIPFSSFLQRVLIDEEKNEITVYTDVDSGKVTYKKLHVFDLGHGVETSFSTRKYINYYRLIDYLVVITGGSRFKLDMYYTPKHIMDYIHVFNFATIDDRESPYKNIISEIERVSEEEMTTNEYSHFFLNNGLKGFFKEHDIKCIRCKKKDGTHSYQWPRIKFFHREYLPFEWEWLLLKRVDNIKYHTCTTNTMLMNLKNNNDCC